MNKILLYLIIMKTVLGAELQIMSYNIHGFGYLISGSKPKSIIDEIFHSTENYDIIFIQENWIFDYSFFENYNSKYNWEIPQNKKFDCFLKLFNPNNSGLTFAFKSDLDIIENNERMFSNCYGWILNKNDCWASKGFMHSIIQIEGSDIHLYNTHLDAGNTIEDSNTRDKQLTELWDYIKITSNNYPLIICGDFNYNYNNPKDSQKILDFSKSLNLKSVDFMTGSDYQVNQREIVDYIFYRDNMKINMKPIKININNDLIDYSDHPPIQVKFEIKQKTNPQF